MASIVNCAKEVFEDACDGILGILLWKTGKSWHIETLLGDVDYDDKTILADEEETKMLSGILDQDRNAILVNGYDYNLGVDSESGNIKILAKALKWQYELNHALLADYSISCR